MAVATKEAVVERIEAPKTFKLASEPTGQEYHYLHRVVGPMALPDGTLTGDMLDMEVMSWLQSGYRIQSVHYLGQHKGPDNNVYGYVYGYHLVRG